MSDKEVFIMLCQNCKKNEANMHMKRIINGRAEEFHLCSDCARSLGYTGSFSDFGLGFGDLLSDFLGRGESSALQSQKCPVCGKTFEDIVSDGKVGCAECYNTFYDKLLPSLKRIHGNLKHTGKSPLNVTAENKTEDISQLKSELEKAVSEQNFELAAQLRDKINSTVKEGE